MPFAVVAVIAVTAGCTLGASCPDMRFAKLRAADRVVITSSMNDPLRTISDPSSISDLVAFAEAHENGWGVPWWGPRGALVRATSLHLKAAPTFRADLFQLVIELP